MMEIVLVQLHIKIIKMKTIYTITIILLNVYYGVINSQNLQYPTNVNTKILQGLTSNVNKVENFPIYFDNIHSMPILKTGQLWNDSIINIQNNVPTVCLDDFRYGHKFDNNIGGNGIGFLSVAYWLPSNGNYLLLYFILENGMDYYRDFLVTTTLSGDYIDHLLVRDGWYDSPASVNFTQTRVDLDLSITVYEVRNLNATYIPYSNLSSFIGQKVAYKYLIDCEGRFVVNSILVGNQRTFSISELKGLISNIPD